ncbi:hypothetical protein Cgig2_023993 [Carnegiea gigantea]|uniref:Uncharacterized protein n=1 Tax=Carnegiea gigantea TaxID=171969 RepID=A0A9Q1KBC4_9CARY|nr:hypothetical protein Cgig2_023993 [Carnegiea gigantea]
MRPWTPRKALGRTPIQLISPLVRQEVYVTVDALKNFMSTMTDAIKQQVSEQVKKAAEAARLARPFPCFEYVPTGGCKPSCRCDPATSPRRSERVQEAPLGGGDQRSRQDNYDRSIGANAYLNHRSSHGCLAKSTAASTPYATQSRRIAWFEDQEQTSGPQRSASERQRTLERRSGRDCTRNPRNILIEVRDNPMLKKPPPMTSAPKPPNAQKYCDEQNRHTIADVSRVEESSSWASRQRAN